MANFEKNNGPESTPAGGSGETKMAGDEQDELPSYNAHELTISNPQPSQHALDVPGSKDMPNKFLSVSETDIIQSPEPETSANISRAFKVPIMDHEKTMMPIDVPEKRKNKHQLDFSIASTCTTNIESSKPSINLMEFQSSSDPSCAVLAPADEDDGKGKELAWLENLDRVLQDKKKEKDTCNPIERSDINCGHASSWGPSFIPAKSSVQTSSDQGKVALTMLGDPRCTQEKGESSNGWLYRNSFGLSSHLNSGAPTYYSEDFVNLLLASSLGVNDNNPMIKKVVNWHGLPDTLASQMSKYNIEDDISRSRMLMRRYSDQWSEEELDCLWVGVRRHGIGNWNAMLRDPRLQFLESRSAEELAMQWGAEQRKVSNRALVQTLSLSRAYHHSTLNHSSNASVWPHSGLQFPTSETRLFPVDAYPRTRNFLHSSGLGTVNAPTGESASTNSLLGSFSMDSAYPKAGTGYQNSFPIRYQWRTSTSLQRPSEILMHNSQPANTNNALPHWLQDALNNRAPGPSESTVSLFTSANPLSVSKVNYSEPPAPLSDSRGRGVLKMKSVGSGKRSSSLRISELPSSQDADVVPNLNKKYLGSIAPSDLVVIDSDASSEETISDNENSRPT